MSTTIVKQGPNYALMSDGTMRFDNVRGSYLYLLTPRQSTKPNDDGSMPKPKFTGNFMMPKSTHMEAKNFLQAQISDFILQNSKGPKIVTPADAWKSLKADNKFLRSGDAEGQAPEHAGHFIITASNTEDRPPLLIIGREKIERSEGTLPMLRSRFYSGCYGSVFIRPWWQKDRGPRVNANLNGFQFRRHGEKLGGGGIDEAGMLAAVEDDDYTGEDDLVEEAGGDDLDGL
jgi:hypothetical protein